MKFRMRDSIYPDDRMVFRGTVKKVETPELLTLEFGKPSVVISYVFPRDREPQPVVRPSRDREE